jgi:hypothetical protein
MVSDVGITQMHLSINDLNRRNQAQNSGDDIAGKIVAIGSDVYEFTPGDRVGAFHEMMQPHGSFAEYAIAHAYSTFHIPKNVSFEGTSSLLSYFIRLNTYTDLLSTITNRMPPNVHRSSNASSSQHDIRHRTLPRLTPPHTMVSQPIDSERPQDAAPYLWCIISYRCLCRATGPPGTRGTHHWRCRARKGLCGDALRPCARLS